MDTPDQALLDGPQTFEQLTPQQAALANAQVPISTLPNPAAAPFSLAGATEIDRGNALNCLTLAVYYEAANLTADAQAAVAQVVLNRVRNVHFPKTVCGVVFQGSELPTGCQFTFTCDGSLLRPPVPALWNGARAIAEQALNGHVQSAVGLATHYHTIWVVPYWQASVLKVAQVGPHVFYRMEGGLGAPPSFATVYAGGEFVPTQTISLDSNLTALLKLAPPTVIAVVPTTTSHIDSKPKEGPVIVAQTVAIAETSVAPPAVSAVRVDPGQKLEPQLSPFGHERQSAPRLPIAAH